MKLRKNRPWVNSQVIFEPLYGRGRVSEPDRLLVTEGITDVLAAQDHGYTCVAPVGTACSPRQFSQLLELVETADTTSLVFDTDENGTGQTKARELAEDLAANNYSTEVVRLPTIHSEESSTDLAEFLNAHSRADLDRILCSGNQRVTPESLQNTPDCSQSHDSSRGYSETSQPETPPTSRRSDVAAASGLFNLTLEDVISAEVGYRGDNPLGHVGESHSDYFAVFKATAERGNPTVKAYDHKANHGYNALTWLACEAGIRHTANPGGRFSNREIWATWRYAKQSGYLLEDDPIPARALWYIAAKHDLLPSKFIPSPSDDLELPASVYGRAIEIVQENYGIETGR